MKVIYGQIMSYEFGIPLEPKQADTPCQLQVFLVELYCRQKSLHVGRLYGCLLRRKLCLLPALSKASFSTACSRARAI